MSESFWTHESIAKGEAHCHEIVKRHFVEENPLQKIEVLETKSYGKGLFLDGRIQHVEADEYVYSEVMTHPALTLLAGADRKVLVVGGGPAGVVRESLKHRTVSSITQVDIDDRMVELSREYFGHIHQGCHHDPRYSLVIDDIREFVKKTGQEFDLVIFDVSEPVAGTPAEGLFGEQVLRSLKDRLAPSGLFVTWGGAAGPRSADLALDISASLNHVFSEVSAMLCQMPSYGTSWLTFVAGETDYQPKKMTPQEIQSRLDSQVSSPLRFYDGETHQHLFHLTKDIRERLQRVDQQRSTDDSNLQPRNPKLHIETSINTLQESNG